MPIFHLATDAISGDRDPANPNLQTFYVLFARLFCGDAITPIGPGNVLDQQFHRGAAH